jgi:hypothetical protein
MVELMAEAVLEVFSIGLRKLGVTKFAAIRRRYATILRRSFWASGYNEDIVGDWKSSQGRVTAGNTDAQMQNLDNLDREGG